MNKIKPHKIPGWKTKEIPPLDEELWELVAAERKRLSCHQCWGPWEGLPKLQEMALYPCTTRRTKTEKEKRRRKRKRRKIHEIEKEEWCF